MTAFFRSLQITTLLALVLATACGILPVMYLNAGSPEESSSDILTVFAAASLTEAISDIAEEFESFNPGSKVVINLAGSQQLAQQLSQGAPADVFASADQEQMENAILAGRVGRGSEKVFINNQLVLILPEKNSGDIQDLGDLDKSGLQVILADGAVPVGRYAMEMLDKANYRGDYGDKFKAGVLNNVVSYEENVRAVLSKILLGEADAGIVYLSDALGAEEGQIKLIEIPKGVNITASYYIAPVSDSSNQLLAQEFIDFILSPAGQEIIKRYGFKR
jgi:molybdate transport system substrate-binding protein